MDTNTRTSRPNLGPRASSVTRTPFSDTGGLNLSRPLFAPSYPSLCSLRSLWLNILSAFVSPQTAAPTGQGSILEFLETKTQRLFSRDLVAALNQLPNRPWSELLKGKPITELWLSQQLRPYGVRPKNILIDGTQAKGYLQADFDDIFRRYITKADLNLRAGEPENEQPPSRTLSTNAAIPEGCQPLAGG